MLSQLRTAIRRLSLLVVATTTLVVATAPPASAGVPCVDVDHPWLPHVLVCPPH